MKREFAVIFENECLIHTSDSLQNFVKVAVLQNRDISKFTVIEIDSRLSLGDAKLIASYWMKSKGIEDLIIVGFSPYEALKIVME